MKTKLLFAFLFAANQLYSQSAIDTTIKVDLLRAPSSPASNLLGIAPSDIEKPTDVSSFMLSLQSATNDFTSIPSNYAIDIAPYWFLKSSKKGDVTTEGFRKSTGKDVFKQTLVLSFAFRNPDSTASELNATSAYGGFGFKFFFFRGKYDKSTNDALDRIKGLQDTKLRHLDRVMTTYRANMDSQVIELKQRRKDLFKGIDLADKSPENIFKVKAIQDSDEYKAITDSLNNKLSAFAELERTEAITELDKQIQLTAASFQTARTGFTWDIAGGVSTEFRNKSFDNTKLYNAGLWTTLGYTDPAYGAGLFLLRLLHNPDKIFANDNMIKGMDDITTFDFGLRYIYSKAQSKFSASFETIYRSVLSSETIDPSWRLVFNADYSIWQNQKLTFSFGRNFDGSVTTDGNLIAALTFLTGFGNKR